MAPLNRQGKCCVYILQCSDGTYYTGSTNNLARRLKTHSAGNGAKYLRGRLPVRLVYARRFRSYKSALKAERSIKQLTRQQKKALIDRPDLSEKAYGL